MRSVGRLMGTVEMVLRPVGIVVRPVGMVEACRNG